MRCRGGDSPARRNAADPNRLLIKRGWPRFVIARALRARGALSAKREEVPLGCNLGKALAARTGRR